MRSKARVSATTYLSLADDNKALRAVLELAPHRLADMAIGRSWTCGCPFCKAARVALSLELPPKTASALACPKCHSTEPGVKYFVEPVSPGVHSACEHPFHKGLKATAHERVKP